MMRTTIRKIENANGIIIPPHLLQKLGLKTGDKVNVDVQDGQIVIIKANPKYTVEELLEQCDPDAPLSEEVKEWVQMKPVGREYGSSEWDSFFSSENPLPEDFFPERTSQIKSKTDSGDDK